MINYEYIGSIAGILTTVSFFPQVLMTVRKKSAGDISKAWLIMMSMGVFFWIAYGYHIASIPIIMANTVTFICLLIIMRVKFFCK